MTSTFSPRSSGTGKKRSSRSHDTFHLTTNMSSRGVTVVTNLPKVHSSFVKEFLANRSAFTGEVWKFEPPSRFHSKSPLYAPSLHAALATAVSGLLGSAPTVKSDTEYKITWEWTVPVEQPKRLTFD